MGNLAYEENRAHYDSWMAMNVPASYNSTAPIKRGEFVKWEVETGGTGAGTILNSNTLLASADVNEYCAVFATSDGGATGSVDFNILNKKTNKVDQIINKISPAPVTKTFADVFPLGNNMFAVVYCLNSSHGGSSFEITSYEVQLNSSNVIQFTTLGTLVYDNASTSYAKVKLATTSPEYVVAFEEYTDGTLSARAFQYSNALSLANRTNITLPSGEDFNNFYSVPFYGIALIKTSPSVNPKRFYLYRTNVYGVPITLESFSFGTTEYSIKDIVPVSFTNYQFANNPSSLKALIIEARNDGYYYYPISFDSQGKISGSTVSKLLMKYNLADTADKSRYIWQSANMVNPNKLMVMIAYLTVGSGSTAKYTNWYYEISINNNSIIHILSTYGSIDFPLLNNFTNTTLLHAFFYNSPITTPPQTTIIYPGQGSSANYPDTRLITRTKIVSSFIPNTNNYSVVGVALENQTNAGNLLVEFPKNFYNLLW